jgi:hypothetical protein
LFRDFLAEYLFQHHLYLYVLVGNVKEIRIIAVSFFSFVVFMVAKINDNGISIESTNIDKV